MSRKADPCAKAQQYYKRGNLESAYTQIGKCVKQVTRNLRDAKGTDRDQVRLQLTRVHQFHAMLAMKLNKLSIAESALEKSINMLNNLTTTDQVNQLLAEAYYSQGLIHIMTKQDPKTAWDNSVKSYIAGKEFAAALKLDLELIKYIDNDEEKVERISSIIKVSKKVKDKKVRDMIVANANIEKSRLQDNEKISVELLKKSKKLFNKRGDRIGVAEVMIEMASLPSNSLENTEEYLIEALDIAKTIDSDMLRGKIYTNLGITSLKLGKFDKGREHLLRGLKYRSDAGDKSGAAQSLLELARITLITARKEVDLDNAISLVDQAIELYTSIGDNFGLTRSHEMASTIHTRVSNYDLAVSHARKARSIVKKLNDKNLESRIIVQLAVALDGMGKDDEVIPLFNKSLKLFKELGSRSGMAEVYYLMGLHISRSDTKKSHEYLVKSCGIYEELRGDNEEMELMYGIVTKKIEEINFSENC